jgi:uncharacterized delta-60 repeat protein
MAGLTALELRRRRSRCLISLVAFTLVGVALVAMAAAAAGDLDPTFGEGGKALTDFGASDNGIAVALQSDGKIVAAGYSDTGGSHDFALVRYRRNGGLDATFGVKGKVLTDFGSGSRDVALAVLVQPDGRIVAAGFSEPVGSPEHFALARYRRDGSLDPSFGSGGKVVTDFGATSRDRVFAIALQPDDKIVAAGGTLSFSGEDFALVRYLPDGSLDPTFGAAGKVRTNFGGQSDYARSVALQLDGKIVAAGTSGCCGGQDFALARYRADGTLDGSFGSGGKVETDVTELSGMLTRGGLDRAFGVAVQSDGRIVAAGEGWGGRNDDFALARYEVDGSLDESFGVGGRVLTDFGAGSSDYGRAVALQQDGKIVVAGTTLGRFDFALTRYRSDGSLDPSFGSSGKVVTDFGGADEVFRIAMDRDGRIVAAGRSNAHGSDDFALARYLGGPPRPSQAHGHWPDRG